MLVAFLTVGGILWATRGTSLDPADLGVGDCLYVRTSASQDVDHPIGTADEVASVLLAGGAERASCDASHGHEVSFVLDLTIGRTTGLDLDCRAAFAGYVGHALDGSRYTTFRVLPTGTQQSAAAKAGVCLIARADGQWMDHPARGSGE